MSGTRGSPPEIKHRDPLVFPLGFSTQLGQLDPKAAHGFVGYAAKTQCRLAPQQIVPLNLIQALFGVAFSTVFVQNDGIEAKCGRIFSATWRFNLVSVAW